MSNDQENSMKSITSFRRSALRRAHSALLACAALALCLVPPARADAPSVSISGDTVKYSVSGLAPEAKYSVKVENDTTGSSTLTEHTTTPEGTIPKTAGSTGDTLGPGTTVHVKVYDEGGDLVGSTSVTTPPALDPPLWIQVLMAIHWALGHLP
jgi:hypothetical protein